ncbi:hypothetical protein BD309DRAFT_746808 [Dichomitus squalens]|uniref:Uncharacterized protein n=1 Tax=Dichomitus squalens TaxID=114155 RepID=A0A4Q9NVN0_9APHY|nr:hypothetical protein BD309DRAFT_746808 [Dichomitus squalens]TBU63947.1 hypothetical protein BD310DRAFT_459249 [Dichomitus squalens]
MTLRRPRPWPFLLLLCHAVPTAVQTCALPSQYSYAYSHILWVLPHSPWHLLTGHSGVLLLYACKQSCIYPNFPSHRTHLHSASFIYPFTYRHTAPLLHTYLACSPAAMSFWFRLAPSSLIHHILGSLRILLLYLASFLPTSPHHFLPL